MTHLATRFALLLALITPAACGDDSAATDAAVVIDARPDQGTLSLSWTLADSDQSVIDCEDVAAVTVSISAFPEGAGSGVPLAFPCSDGQASPRLGTGTYQLRIELRAGAGVLDGPITLNGIEITQDQETALGQIDFEVPTTGGFSFLLDTPPLGSNCDASEGDLTSVLFELRDDADACVPTTFEIGDGAEQTGGTYQSDCQGASFGCIDNDQEITVSGAASGPHTLRITGAKGGVESCYSRNAQITIPGNDLIRDLPAQQLALASIPECDPLAPDAGPTPADAGVADGAL